MRSAPSLTSILLPNVRTFFLFAFIGIVFALKAQDTKIHNFIAETGRIYDNNLVTDGTFLYGLKYDGGIKGNGNIFRINPDGTGFKLIHSFENADLGTNPTGSLLLSGTTLYGMTILGGIYNWGVVFKIETNGTGFQKLMDFNGSNGAIPYGSLIISGSTLFGISIQGGSVGYGVIFKIGTNGTRYQKLLDFSGTNGWTPFGSLTIS